MCQEKEFESSFSCTKVLFSYRSGAIIYQYIYIFLKKSFSFPFSTASGWGMQCWEKRRYWEKEPWVLMKARLKGTVEKIPCLTAQLLCYRCCPRASQPHRGNTLCKHTLGSDSKSIISTSCLWQHLTAVSLLSPCCPLDPHGYHKLSAFAPPSPCPRAIHIIITLPFFGLKLQRSSCHMYNPKYIMQIKVQTFLIKLPCDNTAVDYSTSMNHELGR